MKRQLTLAAHHPGCPVLASDHRGVVLWTRGKLDISFEENAKQNPKIHLTNGNVRKTYQQAIMIVKVDVHGTLKSAILQRALQDIWYATIKLHRTVSCTTCYATRCGTCNIRKL